MTTNVKKTNSDGVEDVRAVAVSSGPAGGDTAVAAHDGMSGIAALISMIERAARDPNVDVDKMERLFGMHKEAAATRAEADYLAALSNMQPALPIIDKRGEIERKAKDESGAKQAAKSTKYAKWEDVVEAINPVLAQNGFSLSFRIAQPSVDRIVVTAVLGHRSGHSEKTSMSLSIDSTGAKNNVQGWGSSVSYGKRYTAFALLNIVARGEDDDGRAAGHVAADQPTLEKLKALVTTANANIGRICQHYSVETLDDLTSKQIGDVMAGLSARLRREQKAKKDMT